MDIEKSEEQNQKWPWENDGDFFRIFWLANLTSLTDPKGIGAMGSDVYMTGFIYFGYKKKYTFNYFRDCNFHNNNISALTEANWRDR